MAQRHYVDNKKLFDALVKYRKQVQSCRRRKRTPPPIPEYIGECLLMIATRLSNKPNFASYTFRDDMISDAIENGLLYLHNFDPEKSQNPFAYFTQITHFAFIRRIEREKKYVYTKYKYALHKAHQKEDHVSLPGEQRDIKEPAWTNYENIHEFIRGYEEKMHRPRPKMVDGDDDEDIIPLDILDALPAFDPEIEDESDEETEESHDDQD